jgi:integrase
MNVVSIPQFYNKKTGRKVDAFSLFVRDRSKGKIIHYVKLRDRNGNKINSPISTEHSDKIEATMWVISNYDRLLNEYYESLQYREGMTVKIFHYILKEYFKSGSKYLFLDKQFGIERKASRNKEYCSLIERFVLPYLNEHHIFHYRDLSAFELNKFQVDCIEKGISNNSITNIFYALKIVFNRLVVEGKIEHNFVNDVILVKRTEQAEKGMFGVKEIKGTFKNIWEENEDEYMIHLISATTGLRNSEIRTLKVADFEIINGIRFIDIKGTKTKSSTRKVPVHNFVYTQIQEYIKRNNRSDYVFLKSNGAIYSNIEVSRMMCVAGNRLGFSKEVLKERNITFHSWRHLYSTILHGAGSISSDWIEYFMGHKQSGVKGIYTHLNNVIGKEVCEKVLSIINELL